MNTFYVKGVSRPIPFPTISYDKKNKKNMPDDTRSTLLWNADLLTGNTGNSTLSLYATDVTATYNVTVTGITVHGDIIYKTITFKANEK